MSGGKQKSPAFLFYSQDFIVGVQTLSFEDRGKYITILCQMHQQGRLDEETICFLVGSVSVKLKSKFLIDENGFWYNERLELEVEKREKYSESRRNNGFQGGRPAKVKKPKENHMVSHMHNHMGNHMDNENILLNTLVNNSNTKEKEKKESKSKITKEAKLETVRNWYLKEIELHAGRPLIESYRSMLNYLFKNNPTGMPADHILFLEHQMEYEQFAILVQMCGGERGIKILYDKIDVMINTPKYLKDKKNLFMTLRNWISPKDEK